MRRHTYSGFDDRPVGLGHRIIIGGASLLAGLLIVGAIVLVLALVQGIGEAFGGGIVEHLAR